MGLVLTFELLFSKALILLSSLAETSESVCFEQNIAQSLLLSWYIFGRLKIIFF